MKCSGKLWRLLYFCCPGCGRPCATPANLRARRVRLGQDLSDCHGTCCSFFIQGAWNTQAQHSSQPSWEKEPEAPRKPEASGWTVCRKWSFPSFSGLTVARWLKSRVISCGDGPVRIMFGGRNTMHLRRKPVYAVLDTSIVQGYVPGHLPTPRKSQEKPVIGWTVAPKDMSISWPLVPMIVALFRNRSLQMQTS